jgi:hypothetical protein
VSRQEIAPCPDPRVPRREAAIDSRCRHRSHDIGPIVDSATIKEAAGPPQSRLAAPGGVDSASIG